jgi:hypothetical protein
MIAQKHYIHKPAPGPPIPITEPFKKLLWIKIHTILSGFNILLKEVQV